MLSNAHLTDALSMAPPDQVPVSAGHTAFGSLPAVSADGFKPDGAYRLQLDMQADAMTFTALFPNSHGIVEANRSPLLLRWMMNLFVLS